MMVMAIENGSSGSEEYLLDQMHALRAKVFKDRLGWQVLARDGRERDAFDDLDPAYILAVTAGDNVVGCARLLPALGPTMLLSVFPQLVTDQTFLPHARMVESSRFCVDTAVQRTGGEGLHQISHWMFAGILEWCLLREDTEVVTVTDIGVERILQRAGWPLRRLGSPQKIGRGNALAGVLDVDRATFEQVKPAGYVSNFGGGSAPTPTVSS